MENKERQLKLEKDGTVDKRWVPQILWVSSLWLQVGAWRQDMQGRSRQSVAAIARQWRVYSYNHFVQHAGFGTPDFYFTALMIAHSFQKSAAKKKEVVLPWGACSSSR